MPRHVTLTGAHFNATTRVTTPFGLGAQILDLKKLEQRRPSLTLRHVRGVTQEGNQTVLIVAIAHGQYQLSLA